MNQIKRFWRMLFYKSPQSWKELQKWCNGGCSVYLDFFSDICHGCKAFKDFVENEKKSGRWFKL